MDCDNEELEATKSVKQAYNTVYTEMRRYMELYNQAEERIKELEEKYINLEHASNKAVEELNKYRKLYFEEKEKQEHIKINTLSKLKVTEQELKDMIIGMLE